MKGIEQYRGIEKQKQKRNQEEWRWINVAIVVVVLLLVSVVVVLVLDDIRNDKLLDKKNDVGYFGRVICKLLFIVYII